MSRDSYWRRHYHRQVSLLHGPEGIERRRELKTEVRAKLTPLGLGFSEWADCARVGQLEGKTLDQLVGSVSHANRFWNRAGAIGLWVGPALVLARVAMLVGTIVFWPVVSTRVTLALEIGACAGALTGGWGLALVASGGGAQVWSSGAGRLAGAIAGGFTGSFSCDWLARRIVETLILGGSVRA